jgi:acetyl esterase/lipase
MNRRSFCKLLATTFSFLSARAPGRAADVSPAKETFVYKTAGDCPLKADVYPAPAEGPRPAVLWLHGGALIMGDRNGVDHRLRGKLLEAGYTVISADYRLAPETKLPAILQDVEDACRWVQGRGDGRLAIDPRRLAVMGASAGGYLTLTTGYRVQPRPRALVSFWGYGDVAGAWYSRPDPFYSRLAPVPKEDAYRAVGGHVLSEGGGKNQRGRFYLYCRQHGLWPKEVVGLDPDREAKAFAPYCPVQNVTADYPPTLLVHGTKDTDVPYDRSAEMDRELERHRVAHQLITIPEGGHGFGGVSPALVAESYQRVLAFLGRHLG